MCVLSSLRCPICGLIDKYGLRLCDSVKENVERNDARVVRGICSGVAFITQCPSFIWPPVQPIPLVEQMCDNCAFIYSPYKKVRDNFLSGKERILDGSGDIKEINGHKDMNNHWPARLSELPHRLLTLRIPWCKLCNTPGFFFTHDEEYVNEYNVQFGIEDIELEINSVLDKWLYLTKGRESVTTNVATGFIAKPCSSCISLETTLRGKVFEFLETCSHIEAWAVWNWLLLRGTGQVDFWNHETNNVGLPDVNPPTRHEFWALMVKGWKVKTGVSWGDVVDLDSTRPLPFISHDEPFITLSQWDTLVKACGGTGRDGELLHPHWDSSRESSTASLTAALIDNEEDMDESAHEADDSRPPKRVKFSEELEFDMQCEGDIGPLEDRSLTSRTTTGSPTTLSTSTAVASSASTTVLDHPTMSNSVDRYRDDELPDETMADLFGEDDSPSTSDEPATQSQAWVSPEPEIANSDAVMDGGYVDGHFSLSELGYWHMVDSKDPRAKWSLPLGVSP